MISRIALLAKIVNLCQESALGVVFRASDHLVGGKPGVADGLIAKIRVGVSDLLRERAAHSALVGSCHWWVAYAE